MRVRVGVGVRGGVGIRVRVRAKVRFGVRVLPHHKVATGSQDLFDQNSGAGLPRASQHGWGWE